MILPGKVYSLAFSPDGKYVLSDGFDKAARVWLWHPDAGAVVTSGQVIFLKHVWEGTRFHEFVTSVPISGIHSGLTGTYCIYIQH